MCFKHSRQNEKTRTEIHVHTIVQTSPLQLSCGASEFVQTCFERKTPLVLCFKIFVCKRYFGVSPTEPTMPSGGQEAEIWTLPAPTLWSKVWCLGWLPFGAKAKTSHCGVSGVAFSLSKRKRFKRKMEGLSSFAIPCTRCTSCRRYQWSVNPQKPLADLSSETTNKHQPEKTQKKPQSKNIRLLEIPKTPRDGG